MTLRFQSVFLAGWIHGVINSQAYGIWRMIVPDAQPLLGGIPGLVGLAVLALAAAAVFGWYGRREPHSVTRR